MAIPVARRLKLWALPAATLCLVGLLLARPDGRSHAAELANKAPAGPRFVRLQRDKAGKPLALQTAIVTHRRAARSGAPQQVDLISAVHVGDKGYYEALNKAFAEYDAVLFELVAPPGADLGQLKKRDSHPVSRLQGGMKDMLELEHQLDCIDYTPANFVHADMSPDEIEKSMKARNESLWTMMLQIMVQNMGRQASQAAPDSTDLDLLAALFDPRRALKLKRILAAQFEDLDTLTAAFEGPKGSTIIGERNKVALEVLGKLLAAGGKQRIAIFYGAGHMPDMAKRLVADFGLKPAGERWLTAWDMR